MCIRFTDKLTEMVARSEDLLPWYFLHVCGLKATWLAGSNMQKLTTKSQAYLVLDMAYHKVQSWGHCCFFSISTAYIRQFYNLKFTTLLMTQSFYMQVIPSKFWKRQSTFWVEVWKKGTMYQRYKKSKFVFMWS